MITLSQNDMAPKRRFNLIEDEAEASTSTSTTNASLEGIADSDEDTGVLSPSKDREPRPL